MQIIKFNQLIWDFIQFYQSPHKIVGFQSESDSIHACVDIQPQFNTLLNNNRTCTNMPCFMHIICRCYIDFRNIAQFVQIIIKNKSLIQGTQTNKSYCIFHRTNVFYCRDNIITNVIKKNISHAHSSAHNMHHRVQIVLHSQVRSVIYSI